MNLIRDIWKNVSKTVSLSSEKESEKKKNHLSLQLLRYDSQRDFTHGLLFNSTGNERHFLTYTLEDEHRTEKVYGETRIPAGTYEITLRRVGGFHQRYRERFSDIHRGMLWIRNVPNFEYILFHVGNKEDDTAGCILVGLSAQPGFIGNSAKAYRTFYPKIGNHLFQGGTVSIEIIDYDTPIIIE